MNEIEFNWSKYATIRKMIGILVVTADGFIQKINTFNQNPAELSPKKNSAAQHEDSLNFRKITGVMDSVSVCVYLVFAHKYTRIHSMWEQWVQCMIYTARVFWACYTTISHQHRHTRTQTHAIAATATGVPYKQTISTSPCVRPYTNMCVLKASAHCLVFVAHPKIVCVHKRDSWLLIMPLARVRQSEMARCDFLSAVPKRDSSD